MRTQRDLFIKTRHRYYPRYNLRHPLRSYVTTQQRKIRTEECGRLRSHLLLILPVTYAVQERQQLATPIKHGVKYKVWHKSYSVRVSSDRPASPNLKIGMQIWSDGITQTRRMLKRLPLEIIWTIRPFDSNTLEGVVVANGPAVSPKIPRLLGFVFSWRKSPRTACCRT